MLSSSWMAEWGFEQAGLVRGVPVHVGGRN